MTNKTPRGYFKYTLAADCETTGIAIGCDDPSYNPVTKETYQAVSWGMAVVDTDTLKIIEKLYVEIQYDKKYKWNDSAERIHGMSKEYLRENGVPMEEAVLRIGELVLKYWGPESPICLLGHNIHTFDLPFLRRTVRSQGLELRFANRHVDTNSIGFAVFESFNSDDLFEMVGLPTRDPNKHNALTDALNCVEVVRNVRAIYDHIIEGK